MSATGRGRVRNKDDFYETPEWCTRAILPHLKPGPVLDPCCGEGAILDVVNDEWALAGNQRVTVDTIGIEIDRARWATATRTGHHVFHRDALAPEKWDLPHTKCQVITNPPYSLAMEFILRAAIEVPNQDRAFLLRLNFLGSQKRAKWLRGNTPDVFVLPKRPSFTPDKKTDATEYAWMIWGPGRRGVVKILEIEEELE
jgi:hypothetical protein